MSDIPVTFGCRGRARMQVARVSIQVSIPVLSDVVI